MTKTTVLDIDELVTDPKNARRRDKKASAAIRASLKRFGAGRSVVVDGQGVVRAGNGTVEAARAEGYKQVVVVEPEPGELVAVGRPDWTEEEAAGYGVADNKTTDLSTFDDAALAAVLKSVPTVDPGVMGFGEQEIRSLLARVNKKEVEQEDVPEPPKVAVTRPGDVWELGRHRLVCGDCRKDAVVGLSGVAVAFMSPPYADRRKYDGQQKMPKPDEYVDWFAPVAAAVKSALAEDGSWFVNIKPASNGIDSETYVMDLRSW